MVYVQWAYRFEAIWNIPWYNVYKHKILFLVRFRNDGLFVFNNGAYEEIENFEHDDDKKNIHHYDLHMKRHLSN